MPPKTAPKQAIEFPWPEGLSKSSVTIREMVVMAGSKVFGRAGKMWAMDPSKMSFARFTANPVVLAEHEFDNPVGRAVKARIWEDRLEMDFYFFANDPDAQRMEAKWEGGARAASFTAIPNDDDQYELYEVSVVAVPRDPKSVSASANLDEDAQNDVADPSSEESTLSDEKKGQDQASTIKAHFDAAVGSIVEKVDASLQAMSAMLEEALTTTKEAVKASAKSQEETGEKEAPEADPTSGALSAAWKYRAVLPQDFDPSDKTEEQVVRAAAAIATGDEVSASEAVKLADERLSKRPKATGNAPVKAGVTGYVSPMALRNRVAASNRRA